MSAFCGGPHEKSNVDQRLNKQNNQLEGFLNGAFLLLLYTSAPINPFFLAWMICCVRAMEIITQNTKQEGSEMSGAQMAHFLKQVGNEYSARDCAARPLKLSIHSGGIEHACRRR